jgi:SAM-dependent methyltransferase
MTGRLGEIWRNLIAETIATDSYWWIAPQHAALYEDMKPVVETYARGKALDMGAGQLAWRELLSQNVDWYTSGDLVAGHPQLDVVFDVTGRVPFADGSFDTVFCCSVLEHAVEPWEAFSEMWRILAPGGVAIVSLPFVYNLHDEPHDYYRFTRYGIQYLATRAGFDVEMTVVNGGLFHLFLNLPSIALATLWRTLGVCSFIRPTTRFWLALARKLDRVNRLNELFASNHIVALRKKQDRSMPRVIAEAVVPARRTEIK